MNATEEMRLALEAVAYDDHATPGERLRALEALQRFAPADGIATFDLSGLSGDALDAELAGFFQPGAVLVEMPELERVDLPEDEIAATVIEHIASEERTTAFKKATAALAKVWERVGEKPEEEPAQRGARVVPLRPSEATPNGASDDPWQRARHRDAEIAKRLETQKEAGRVVLAQERRQSLPPAIRDHIPPGVDPAVEAMNWPSGRP